MPSTTKGDAKIYFETMGPKTDKPLVFIEGMSAQMLSWRESFCQLFIDQGFWVVRLDNRDVGLSQKFGGPGDIDGGYELDHMADDVFAVLDELGLASAHIVGQSLGGMIAQIMAISHPERVRSMTLFYTAPAASDRYRSDEIAAMIAQHRDAPAASTREQAIEDMVTSQRFSSSPAYEFEEDWIRELAGLRYDRCHCPDGPMRQYTAAARAPDRLTALDAVDTPTAIIHGRADRLIKFEAALDMGRALKHSELHVFPGLGHEIARPLWPEFMRIITRTADRGGGT